MQICAMNIILKKYIYAHLNFHYPQHQDRPGRVNVRQKRQDLLVLCIFLPDNISLIPRYLGFQVLFWYFAPDTWSLPFLTWYLICMTLSSLQVSINDGGWEHWRSAPPFVLKCIGKNQIGLLDKLYFSICQTVLILEHLINIDKLYLSYIPSHMPDCRDPAGGRQQGQLTP